MSDARVRDNGKMRFVAAICLIALPAFGQSINSGTVIGQVADPSGALIAGATARLTNAVTGYDRSVTADSSGTYRFNSVPINNYHLVVSAAGFTSVEQNVDVRNSVPVVTNVSLGIAGSTETVTVQAARRQVETDTSTHQDVDRSALAKLPTFGPGGGLNDAITYSTGAVAADANGFFHPVGDHAQTSYMIDGQPISDQQSKTIFDANPAERASEHGTDHRRREAQYGDKTSLVVNATTRSGLGATKPFGSIESGWGSFGT